MSKGPSLLVSEKNFRIVEIGEGDYVKYVLEVEDGCDALGVERWREFRMENKHLRDMYGFMLQLARKQKEQG